MRLGDSLGDAVHDERTGAMGLSGQVVKAAEAETSGASAALAAALVVPDAYIGTEVEDRYRILSKLGEGGMGAVYLAEHKVIERKVAIKILSQDFARKADLVQRFIQEARAAARIGHENIVEVYDFGETVSGSVFFAMEHLEGQDLAQLIRNEAPLPIPRVKHIVGQICRALAAAHGKKIIHRDLKPENIFLVSKEGKSDFVKVLDFGIAKISNVEEDKGRLTRTGMIFGTPEYMSPEQARGEAPDHRVDIYAMGCILYEMLTSTVPFAADTFMGVLTKHMFEPVEPPSRRARKPVPAEIEAICLRALEKDRDRRFQTMQELALALEGDTGRAFASDPSSATVSAVVAVFGGDSSRSHRAPPPASPIKPQITPQVTPQTSGTLPAYLPSAPGMLLAGPSNPSLGSSNPSLRLMPGPAYAPLLAGSGGRQDATAQSPLPGVPRRTRRRWFIIAGVVVGLGVLAVFLSYNMLVPQNNDSGEPGETSRNIATDQAGVASSQPLTGPTTAPAVATDDHPPASAPTPVPTPANSPGKAAERQVGPLPSPVPLSPSLSSVVQPARLILRGTNGAEVLLNNVSQGKIPLELPVRLEGATGMTAQLSVRKKGYAEFEESLILHPGLVLELNVPLARRNAKGAVAREVPVKEAPTGGSVKEAAIRPDKDEPPKDKKELRNPFGGN